MVQIVLELLGREADVNSLDRYGQTALMLAAQAGHRFFVSDLTPNFEQIAKEFLGRPIPLELA